MLLSTTLIPLLPKPAITPVLLRPPVNVLLASEIPELPVMTPLLETLVVFALIKAIPAAELPLIKPAFVMLPVTVVVSTVTPPAFPLIVAPAVLTIQPPRVELAILTPCALVPLIDPELLRPKVTDELATEIPVAPVIVPLLLMLAVLTLDKSTPAADVPEIKPALIRLPVIVELSTLTPATPVIVAPAVLTIEPPRVELAILIP